MYALVDCNNFYCSCERVFDPSLERRPVIVLSNNDGCAISRSDEAKAAGIKMGAPAFLIEDVIRRYNVAVLSSNYTLYGDMSDRVMKTLATFCTRMEIYSIDEAYLDLHNMAYADLLDLGIRMRRKVTRDTGIPTTVGIAPTKTLAKIANRYAKKTRRDIGVFWAANDKLVNEMLRGTAVADICGIGPRHALFLKKSGFSTAADFILAPDEWVRVNMSVVGLRLLNELRGTPSIQLEPDVIARKNICTSRSFGKLLDSEKEVAEALSNYVANCALKLRAQKTCCTGMNIFIQTNPHKLETPQYFRSIDLELETASNNTAELIKYAMKGLAMIFAHGFMYMKAGVIVTGLVPEETIQKSIFDHADRNKNHIVMQTLDAINRSLGKETVRMAVQGFEKTFRRRAAHLSPCYTTNMNDLLKVNNDGGAF